MAVEDTEYQKEYDKAYAEQEAAAQATTARGSDGKFAKAAPEPEKAKDDKPTEEPAKTEPVKDEKEAENPDPIAELTARLEKAEKIAKDNQAWATRLAQENAQARREREQQERDAKRPAILDANPELAEAIRFVAEDPATRHAATDKQAEWQGIVEKAHPGIFSKDIDPELEKSLMTRLSGLDDATRQDPLAVIREITEEKLAFTERQVGKRFAAEAAKLKEKSAMGVPGAGAGGGSRAAPDAALAEVERIKNMSDADFRREVAKVKGY